MAIEVEVEDVGWPAMECCAFCRSPTNRWYKPKDVAVCLLCSKHAEAKDVPTKKAWFRREQIAMHRKKI